MVENVDDNRKRWLVIFALAIAFYFLSFFGGKQFFLGLLLSVVGYIIVWQTEWLVYNAGRIPFAERFFRTAGGSRFLYKTLGTLIIFWGFMVATGLDEPILQWLSDNVLRPGRL